MFKPNAIVRYSKPSIREKMIRFRVVEDNGDRVKVQQLTDGDGKPLTCSILPVEVVPSSELTGAIWVGVREEEKPKQGRQHLTLWSGWFSSDYEGEAVALPKNNGFMAYLYGGAKVRIECEAPRTDNNYKQVDRAIALAVAGHI